MAKRSHKPDREKGPRRAWPGLAHGSPAAAGMAEKVWPAGWNSQNRSRSTANHVQITHHVSIQLASMMSATVLSGPTHTAQSRPVRRTHLGLHHDETYRSVDRVEMSYYNNTSGIGQGHRWSIPRVRSVTGGEPPKAKTGASGSRQVVDSGVRTIS